MIKAVDKAFDTELWITISNIAVPLKACTAMAAEIAGASMLTAVLDFLFDKKQSRKTSTVVLSKSESTLESERLTRGLKIRTEKITDHIFFERL